MLALGAGLSGCLSGCSDGDREFGSFQGDPQVRLLDDGRRMELLADFAYFEPGGRKWDAKTGAKVDGASIPQAFWSLIGGPFEGLYRKASIVHDVACEKKDRDWRDVHRMFYTACRCDGVAALEAKILYAAVYHFGPRWGSDTENETRLINDDDFDRVQLVIATDPEITTREIEKQTPMTLRQKVPTLPARPKPGALALPSYRSTFGAKAGRNVRISPDDERIELVVPDEGQGQATKSDLKRIRATAASPLDAQRRDLQGQIAATRDPAKRQALATRLLALNRERAALDRVDIEVKVQH
jgi:Protein of unknown function (DUF1353)